MAPQPPALAAWSPLSATPACSLLPPLPLAAPPARPDVPAPAAAAAGSDRLNAVIADYHLPTAMPAAAATSSRILTGDQGAAGVFSRPP